MGLQWVVLSNFFGSTARTVPLSSYALPFHSPFQVIGLPTFQLVSIFVPCRYRLTFAGSVRACQTASTDALMVICFSATNVLLISCLLDGPRSALTECMIQ